MNFEVGTKYRFKNKHSQKYLDIAGNQVENNARVQQFELVANAPSEHFFMHKLDNDYYAIINANSGKVIDITGNSLENNSKLQQFEWLGNAPSEYWYFHPQSDGYYVIESKLSGKVIDITGNSLENNAEAQQFQFLEEAPSERFSAEVVGSVPLPTINTQPLAPLPTYESINDQLPEETARSITAFTVVPFISVRDPHYGNDTARQVKENPYYMVVKKQWWKQQEAHVLAPGETYKYTSKTGIRQTDQETATKTVSWSVGADMGFSFKGFSMGMSTQYSTELQTSVSHTTEELKEETFEHTIPNPSSSERMAYAHYILVTEYTVMRRNGTIVNNPWTLTDKTKTHTVTYPSNTSLSSKNVLKEGSGTLLQP
ncbi:RICIN domain-containing protein (plasmid) [Priestia sp. MF3]|uniref:RICIN domain-containing protein n=1 Tax=Priestia sp. MF3 TaxID=3404779 RepID=UPI003BA2ED89